MFESYCIPDLYFYIYRDSYKNRKGKD